jgi:hypothetical protein
MEPIEMEEIRSRKIDLPLKKLDKGIKHLLLFDLDETLAHCVRQDNPERPPDVRLKIPLQNGNLLDAGFNIRPYCREML